MIRYTLLPLLLKHQLVKPLAEVPAVHVRHRPHGPDDAAETAVLHRGGEMECLVRMAPWVRELGGMRSGQEREFCRREMTPRQVEQRQTTIIAVAAAVAVEPDRRVERSSAHQFDRAGDVGEAVSLEMVDHGGLCRLLADEAFHLRAAESLYRLDLLPHSAGIGFVVCHEEQRRILFFWTFPSTT